MRFLATITALAFCTTALASSNHTLIDTMKDMFQTMVIRKDINSMQRFYTKDFTLESNGKTMHYPEFYKTHKRVYASNIQYRVQYDDATWVEQGNNVAGRLWITTTTPQQSTKIQVMLIATYRDGKIAKLWELTYPNWQNLKAFKILSGSTRTHAPTA